MHIWASNPQVGRAGPPMSDTLCSTWYSHAFLWGKHITHMQWTHGAVKTRVFNTIIVVSSLPSLTKAEWHMFFPEESVRVSSEAKRCHSLEALLPCPADLCHCNLHYNPVQTLLVWWTDLVHFGKKEWSTRNLICNKNEDLIHRLNCLKNKNINPFKNMV